MDSLPSPQRTRSRSLETEESRQADNQALLQSTEPVSSHGQQFLPGMSTPIKALKVPDDDPQSPREHPQYRSAGHVIGELGERSPVTTESQPGGDCMHVLVAEDDPVNSRIIKKRLEKLGHEIQLTVNGEECATAYADRGGYFDVILMDMQVSSHRDFFPAPTENNTDPLCLA